MNSARLMIMESFQVIHSVKFNILPLGPFLKIMVLLRCRVPLAFDHWHLSPWLPPKWPRSCCGFPCPLHLPFPQTCWVLQPLSTLWGPACGQRGSWLLFVHHAMRLLWVHLPGCVTQPCLFTLTHRLLWEVTCGRRYKSPLFWGYSNFHGASMIFWARSQTGDGGRPTQAAPPISPCPDSPFSPKLVELYLGWEGGQWEGTLFLGHGTESMVQSWWCRGRSGRASAALSTVPGT